MPALRHHRLLRARHILHPFSACIHPTIKKLQTLYHNEAVHLIANAIETGEHGGSGMLVNAGVGPNGRQSVHTVPAELLPGYTKRPDICLLRGWPKAKLLTGYPPPSHRARVQLVFIEFCFSNDYFLTEKIVEKQEKYTPATPWHPPLVYNRHLLEELRARGFAALGVCSDSPPDRDMLLDTGPLIPVVVIGHSGVILERTLHLFRELGMSPSQATTLANKLNLLAVKRIDAILAERERLVSRLPQNNANHTPTTPQHNSQPAPDLTPNSSLQPQHPLADPVLHTQQNSVVPAQVHPPNHPEPP